MAEYKRKIKYSLLAAAGIFAAAALCLSIAGPQENASALVYFTDGGSEARLRESVAADIDKTARDSGADADELKKALSVSAFGSGAKITLSGLDFPDNSPVILTCALKNAEISEGGNFKIISYCDIAENVYFPAVPISICAGMAGGLAVYGAMSLGGRIKQRRNRISAEPDKLILTREPEKSHEPETDKAVMINAHASDKSEQSVPQKTVPIIGAADRFYESAVNLGVLPSKAPDGLEAAGYMTIARALSSQKSPLIIAVSSAGIEADSVPYSIKAASYLACAFGAMGKHTAVIECGLKNPSLGKFFKKSGKGGICAIAAGKCTIPESVVKGARRGVDIYAENEPCPMPQAVLATTFFHELISFMSEIYDVILLTAPLPREDEWKYIARECDGVIIASRDGKRTDPISAAEILKSEIPFTAFCESENISENNSQ